MCSMGLANTNVTFSSKLFHISILCRCVPNVLLFVRIALVFPNAIATGLLPLLWVNKKHYGFCRAERDARRPRLGVGALLDGAVFRMCCVEGSRAGVGTSLPAGEGSSS